MTKIAQVDDHASVLAWSPVKGYADVVALGTKDSGGVGFDDYGGELELYNLNITSPEGTPTPKVIGSVKTTSRFSSIGWSVGAAAAAATPGGADVSKMGLIAGGMNDGTVNVWDPSAMLLPSSSSSQPSRPSLLSTFSRHKGGVSALQFNPHNPMELVTGGSDGEVLVTSLEDPKNPKVSDVAPGQPKQSAEITQLAWNSQVPHIVASAAGNGTVTVWDLKQKKAWCELRCGPVSDLAWNPTEGLHMITASLEDRDPVLKLWDLRASTTMPLATLQGHSQGILSMAWCPHDDSLLLSSGKDNRTLLWDLFSMKCIAELPNESDTVDASASASNVYGGGLSSSQQKRYDVQWSPLLRGVISTCSFDRKVQAHSVLGASTKCGRPPKWLKPSSGLSCGFGGTVVSFTSTDKAVTISSAVEEPDLRAASMKFEESIAGGDYTGFCKSMAEKASNAGDAYGNQLWGFMQIIFEANAREQLLQYLGFDPDQIKSAAMEFSDNSSAPTADMAGLSLKSKSPPAMSKKAEDAVKQALLVGNFEAAVECCFRSGNMADALILASCGGAELWAKTQAEYFTREAEKRPFLSIVNAVIKNELEELVASSDPKEWHETLAILSTYGKSEEFPTLCLALGKRLEEVGDAANASLCYMCGLKLDQAVKYWKIQLDAANEAKGATDLLALHAFVEKVSVFLQAVDANTPLDPEVGQLFADYAEALANQGLLATAAKYCRSESQGCKELKDRLYRSKESPKCLEAMGSAPEFPYSMSNVGVAPAGVSPVEAKQQQEQPAASSTSVQQPKQVQSSYQPQTTSQPTQQPAQNTSSPQLSPGWMALQDPSSGRTYYANQSTGETSWEMPTAVQSTPTAPQQQQQPHQQASTSAAAGSYQQPTAAPSAAQQPVANGTSAASVNTQSGSTLASKYGDGFVSSASHPELAEQYGNVGTSNAYMGASRPGTAAAVVGRTEIAPASGPVDLNQPPELSAEHKPISDGLVSFVGYFSGLQLSVNEKKQLSEIERGVGIFIKKLSRGQIESDIVTKVGQIVTALQNRDFVSAGAIQTGLVNSEWREHKDWLKGIKFLIQLAGKRQ